MCCVRFLPISHSTAIDLEMVDLASDVDDGSKHSAAVHVCETEFGGMKETTATC